MVSREAVPFLCFSYVYDLRVRQKWGAGGLPYFFLKSISRILCVYLGLHLVNILLCELLLILGWFDVIITIQMQKVLWLHIILIPHAEGRCPGGDSLQLILKRVAPAVALNDEQDFPPPHFIQVFVAVASNLAYDRFERLVGVGAFFRFPSSFSSISFSMVEGIADHSARISSTVLIMSMISAREAE